MTKTDKKRNAGAARKRGGGGDGEERCEDEGRFDQELGRLKKELMKKASEHLNEWAEGTDALAIFKANFAVDYYCTRMVALCQSAFGETPTIRPDGRVVQAEKGKGAFRGTRDVWENSVTYDLFKPGALFADYETMLQKALKMLGEMVADFRLALEGALWNLSESRVLGIIRRTFTDETVWSDVPLPIEMIASLVSRALQKHTEYYASGYGMFRLVAMHGLGEVAVGDEDSLKAGELCPCDCSCRSLLFLSVLLSCRYPRERLHVVMQSFSAHDTKATHWAALCEHPVSMLEGSDGVIRTGAPRTSRYPIWSAQAFAKLTANNVPYYGYVTTDERVKRLLRDLREELKAMTVAKEWHVPMGPKPFAIRPRRKALAEISRTALEAQFERKLSAYSSSIVAFDSETEEVPLEVTADLERGYTALFSIVHFWHHERLVYIPYYADVHFFLNEDAPSGRTRYVGEVTAGSLDDDDDFRIEATYVDVPKEEVPEPDVLKEAFLHLAACLTSLVGVQAEHHILSRAAEEPMPSVKRELVSFALQEEISDEETAAAVKRLVDGLDGRVSKLHKEMIEINTLGKDMNRGTGAKMLAELKRVKDRERKREMKGGHRGGKVVVDLLPQAVLRMVLRDLKRIQVDAHEPGRRR